MIKITKLKISNYRGIKTLEADVPKGAIAKGRNGSGKTSVLNAIGAALAAADIGPDAVRIGEADGEILIDLDHGGIPLKVRRRFGASGSTLKVTNEDGDTKAKPAALLSELLGSAPLDVIDVVLEKDKKKRRELILSALPVRVTVEQLRRWVPALPDTFDVSGHGLEVIERLRQGAYEKRAAANKVAKDAVGVASRAADVARDARKAVPAGAPTNAALAAEEREAAAKVLATLQARREAAEEQRGRMAGLREEAAKLRALAAEDRKVTAPSPATMIEAQEAFDAAERDVRDLEERLAAARNRVGKASERLEHLNGEIERERMAREHATEREARAAKIEAGIAAATTTVPAEQIADAEKALLAATERHVAAVRHEEATIAEDRAKEAKAAADKAQQEADRLDAVVKKLTAEAPAALLAETPGVAAGLELEGDEVRLGGVSLDRLCGAEQMRFAADIAKALNPGVGFLVVDGLERLDPEQLEAFVAAATEGGRQLFGSIVDRGELTLAAIEPAAVDVAAEEE